MEAANSNLDDSTWFVEPAQEVEDKEQAIIREMEAANAAWFDMIKSKEKEAEANSICTICKLSFSTLEALAEHNPSHFRKMVYSEYGVEIDEEKQKEDEKKERFACPLCKFGVSTAEALAHDIMHYRVVKYISFKPVDEEDYYEKIGVYPSSSVAPLEYRYEKKGEDGKESWLTDENSIILPRFCPVAPLQDGFEKMGEDGKECWMTDKNANFLLRMYAEAALDYYNKQNVGERYALVEHGPYRTTGSINHINFKAKKEDCSNAQVETFFAQLTFDPHPHPQMNKPAFWVDCCVSLGLSHNLPHWRNAELGGCGFCGGIINHPTEKVAGLSLLPNYYPTEKSAATCMLHAYHVHP